MIERLQGWIMRVFDDPAWATKDYRQEGVSLGDDEFSPSLDIFLGDIYVLDGLVVNWFLTRLPIVANTDIRHRIITGMDTDILATHIGTLKGAQEKARQILEERLGIVEGEASEANPVRQLPG